MEFYSLRIINLYTRTREKLTLTNLMTNPCFSGIVELNSTSNHRIKDIVRECVIPHRPSTFINRLTIMEPLHLYLNKKDVKIPMRVKDKCGIITIYQLLGISLYQLIYRDINQGKIVKFFKLNIGNIL